MKRYVIGVDFGTDSCRVLIVDALTGYEIASSVQYYPRWKEGMYCNPTINQNRQHPVDYIETLEWSIKEAISKSPSDIANKISGIGIDTTGSTPVITDKNGTPLALKNEFADNPNAMFVLWKDHTATTEAKEINELSKKWHTDYTKYQGGVYSSEWVWAKVLNLLREDKAVRANAYSWVEHCDWIPALLTGNTNPEIMFRSRCAAGHKAMWHPSWGGLLPETFFNELDPLLKGFRSRLFTKTYTSDTSVGKLTSEWAYILGVSTDVKVTVGAFDCHMGAVGAQIKPNTLVKTIGTSTCDIMIVPYDEIGEHPIPGICGQVNGSVIPSMIGLEAGQSAYGDIFAWFRQILEWPLENLYSKFNSTVNGLTEQLLAKAIESLIPALSEEAEKTYMQDCFLVATDWFNGRRTPNANQELKGTISGLSLGITAPMIFRALVESAAFGAKAINEHFLNNGVKINEVVAIGGISYKSSFAMQTLADVLGVPVKVAKSEQCCALGAAMFAAVASNIHEDVIVAQKKMGQGFKITYNPDVIIHQRYQKLYSVYSELAKFTEDIVT